MSDLKELIGRKYLFRRGAEGNLDPVHELPSATWFHPDGSVQPVEMPTDEHVAYSEADIEFVTHCGPKLVRDRKGDSDGQTQRV